MITRITSDEAYSRLDEPFNPPTTLSEEEFEAVFDSLHERLNNALSEFGTNNPYGEGDYYLDDTANGSRGIGLEASDEFLTWPVIRVVQNILESNTERWEVMIRSPLYSWIVYIGTDYVLGAVLSEAGEEVINRIEATDAD
jgi:hypothetical protein